MKGTKLEYALSCGGTGSVPQRVLQGRNLWDVTEPVSGWLTNAGEEESDSQLELIPVYGKGQRGIRTEEGSLRSADAEKAKNGKLPLEEVEALLETLLSEDREREAAASKETQEIDAALTKISALLTLAEEQGKTRDRLDTARADLKKEKAARAQYERVFEENKAREPERKALEEQAAALRLALPDYQERDRRKGDVTAGETAVKTLREQADILSKNEKTLIDTLDRQRAEADRFKNAAAERERLRAEKDALQTRKTALASLSAAMRDARILQTELKNEQANYTRKRQEADRKKREYDEKHRAYLDEQAGILAEELKDGEPCPVCGSVHHPAPAGKSPEAPTKAELETLKTEAETASDAVEAASRKASEKKAALDEKVATVTEKAGELLPDVPLSELSASVKAAAEALDKAIEEKKAEILAADKKVERYSELGKIIPGTERSLENCRREAKENAADLASAAARLSELRKRLQELSEKLRFDSGTLAKQEITNLTKRAADMAEALENAEKNVQDSEKKIAGFQATIRDSEKALEGAPVIDADGETARQQTLTGRKTVLQEEEKAAGGRITQNAQTLERLRALKEEGLKKEKELRFLKNLSDTANGTLREKNKIMLETYVQTAYFDRITDRANLRLLVMSGGQYELRRVREADQNRSQSGLDLNVLDHHSGKERSVKTLSGGESFMASLALALGLSDEIQASAGGIRLDTMFVDEGFGSLDEETLEKAMQSLTGLTEGNRLVGIISHVSELRDRIDRQIRVTKDRDGKACAEIVC